MSNRLNISAVFRFIGNNPTTATIMGGILLLLVGGIFKNYFLMLVGALGFLAGIFLQAEYLRGRGRGR